MNGVWKTCSKQQICANPGLEHRIDWTDPKSLDNWTQETDMNCYSGWEIGMFGSCGFIGYSLMGFVMMWLNSLKVGRKPQIIIGTLGTFITQVLIIAFPNQYSRYFFRICLGIFRLGWVNTYMLCCELFPKKHVSKITAIFFFWDFSLILLISTFYFYYISVHYLYLLIGALILIDIPLCMLCFELPESPKWLIEEGLYNEA